jgi:hypothetical protein
VDTQIAVSLDPAVVRGESIQQGKPADFDGQARTGRRVAGEPLSSGPRKSITVDSEAHQAATLIDVAAWMTQLLVHPAAADGRYGVPTAPATVRAGSWSAVLYGLGRWLAYEREDDGPARHALPHARRPLPVKEFDRTWDDADGVDDWLRSDGSSDELTDEVFASFVR